MPAFISRLLRASSPSAMVTSIGVAIAVCSSLYLSGWSGASNLKSITLISVILFSLIFIYMMKLLHKVGSTSSVGLLVVMTTIPFVPPLTLFTIKHFDHSYFLGISGFTSCIGLGGALVSIFAPRVHGRFLAYLPLGQLIVLVLFLALNNYFDLRIVILLIHFAGNFAFIFLILRPLRFQMRQPIPPMSNLGIAAISSAIGIFFLLMISSFSPILGYDALSMKVWLPRQWLSNNLISMPTEHILSGVSGSFSFMVLLTNPTTIATAGNSIQLLSLLYTFVLLIIVATRYFSLDFSRVLLYGLILFAIPANVWQVSNSYDDLWVMATFSSALLFVAQQIERQSINGLYLSAMVLGAASSSKFTVLPLCIIGLMFTIYIAIKSSNRLSPFKSVSNLFFLFIISASPLLVWKWFTLENPVWPLFNAIFRAPNLPFVNISFNLPYSEFSVKQILLSPVTTIITPNLWGEEGAPGSYGSIWALILISTFYAFYRGFNSEKFRFFCLTLLAFLAIWLFYLRYSRYLIYIVPISILVLAIAEIRKNETSKNLPLVLGKRSRSIAVFLVGAAIASSLTIGNPISPVRIPYHYLLSSKTSIDFYSQYSPQYRILSHLNQVLPKDSLITGVGIHQRIWTRPDIDIYHDWEVPADIKSDFWTIQELTDLDLTLLEKHTNCHKSIVFESYLVTAPGCDLTIARA